ncbi:MAG: hypothetical protein IJB33_00215, partial [Akkermansia sp.]|nr:hypothetical protein [Akkermansia sp.]
RPAVRLRRILQRIARSFGLPRVGVPQSIHETSPHVKRIFQKFFIFLQHFSQKIEKSTESKSLLCHLLTKPREIA